MDMTYLGYMAMFALLLANALDLFGAEAANTEAAGGDGEEPPVPTYVPEDFTAEVIGSAGADALTAPEGGRDMAWSLGAGDDRLTASEGDDYAEGGAGNDRLFLEEGDDIALGGEGGDLMRGGAGADSLAGGSGADTLLGGDGADLLLGGDGNDVLSGYGADRSQAEGSAAVDGFDTLHGGAGDDRLVLGLGDQGHGGAGEDLFQIDNRQPESEQIAQITDFSEGDRIELLYEPAFDAEGQEVMPEISVSANDEGTAGIIRFGDLTVAEVIGGQALTAEDVTLLRQG